MSRIMQQDGKLSDMAKHYIEAIISEGLADHSANEITERKSINLWDKALNAKQLTAFRVSGAFRDRF